MITPLDIENKKFSKQMMNGYSVDEVDDFLDEIMEDYEANYKELATLRPKIEELNNSLEHYRNIENTLQNTLVMAQTTAEEVKNVARQQADQIVSDAQREAENIIRNSKTYKHYHSYDKELFTNYYGIFPFMLFVNKYSH